MCVPAHLLRVKQKIRHVAIRSHTVACNFSFPTIASDHTRHTSGAHHKLALSLPHCTLRVWYTGTVDTYL